MSGLLAEALYRLGRDVEALEATELGERSAAPDDVLSHVIWRSVRAKLLARAGELAQAERLALDAVALVVGTDDLSHAGDASTSLATVLLAAGKTEDARAAALKALELYGRKGNVASAPRAQSLLGES